MASIHVIQGPDKGRTFELPNDEQIVGRMSESMPLTDGAVSRRHSRLYPDGGAWMIEDLGSANGTYVNGVKLRRTHRLQQGDQIRVGSTLLVFGGPGPGAIGDEVNIAEDDIRDSSIMATVPSNEDSVILPTPEAGAQAIGNLRQLYDFIRTISTIFDVNLLLNRVMDHVFKTLNPDRGFILMADDVGGRMRLAAVRYRDDNGDNRVPISRTIIEHVTSRQVGVLCSNAMADKRFAKGKSVHDFGIRSALCVPIKGRDRILGILHVDASVSNYTYSTEQLRLLTAIGYQTGLAVENVKLYESAVKSERLAAVGETVAALSHHIKNLLQALLGGTDVVAMALDKGNLDAARDAWPIVTRNLDRINGLILNMLAFSKRRQPLLQTMNINPLVQEAMDLVAAQADEKQVAILGDLNEVPPAPVDIDGLHQALLNLLTNALDAVQPETGVITVTTDYDSLRRNVRIIVTDNGPGIPPDQKEQIFEPFFSTKGQKGTGLGLAVTRKIIREHGGDLQLTSSPGEGTTFTITLSTDPQTPDSAEQTHGPGA